MTSKPKANDDRHQKIQLRTQSPRRVWRNSLLSPFLSVSPSYDYYDVDYIFFLFQFPLLFFLRRLGSLGRFSFIPIDRQRAIEKQLHLGRLFFFFFFVFLSLSLQLFSTATLPLLALSLFCSPLLFFSHFIQSTLAVWKRWKKRASVCVCVCARAGSVIHDSISDHAIFMALLLAVPRESRAHGWGWILSQWIDLHVASEE